MERSQRSRQYSISFIGVVALVTIGLALVAWSAQDQALALGSAVLGLYALHLISIRYILEGQARNQEQLETQWNLLQPKENYFAKDLDDRPYEAAFGDLGRTFPHNYGDGKYTPLLVGLTHAPGPRPGCGSVNKTGWRHGSPENPA